MHSDDKARDKACLPRPLHSWRKTRSQGRSALGLAGHSDASGEPACPGGSPTAACPGSRFRDHQVSTIVSTGDLCLHSKNGIKRDWRNLALATGKNFVGQNFFVLFFDWPKFLNQFCWSHFTSFQTHCQVPNLLLQGAPAPLLVSSPGNAA